MSGSKSASIRIPENIRDKLRKLKTHRRESYGDVIKRLIKLKGGKLK